MRLHAQQDPPADKYRLKQQQTFQHFRTKSIHKQKAAFPQKAKTVNKAGTIIRELRRISGCFTSVTMLFLSPSVTL